MVSITTLESKTTDGVLFYENADSIFKNTPPRVVRTATLDGGAVIDHRGFCDGDREFTILASLDEQTAADLWTIHQSETIVNISCIEGFFKGAISECNVDNGKLRLIFLVKEGAA